MTGVNGGGPTNGMLAPVDPTMTGVPFSAEADDRDFWDVSFEYTSLSEDSGGVFVTDGCETFESTAMNELTLPTLPTLCEGKLIC